MAFEITFCRFLGVILFGLTAVRFGFMDRGLEGALLSGVYPFVRAVGGDFGMGLFLFHGLLMLLYFVPLFLITACVVCFRRDIPEDEKVQMRLTGGEARSSFS